MRSTVSTMTKLESRFRRETTANNRVDLARLGRLIWTELPLLVEIDLLLTLAGTVVAVTAVTLVPFAPLVAALLIGPIWLGSTAVCLRLLNGDAPGFRDLIHETIVRAGAGIRLASVPGAVATLLIGTVALMNTNSRSDWMLAPVAADALVLIVLLFASLVAFPLAIATDIRGRDRWMTAISLSGQHIVTSAGLIALGVLIALSLRIVGPFLAITLVGPFCLLSNATVLQTMLAPLGDESSRPQDSADAEIG